MRPIAFRLLLASHSRDVGSQVAEIEFELLDHIEEAPEKISHFFHVATSGRTAPVTQFLRASPSDRQRVTRLPMHPSRC